MKSRVNPDTSSFVHGLFNKVVLGPPPDQGSRRQPTLSKLWMVRTKKVVNLASPAFCELVAVALLGQIAANASQPSPPAPPKGNLVSLS